LASRATLICGPADGAGAGDRPSAEAVALSTLPVACSPRARWNDWIAPAVAEPNFPSAPPRRLYPALINAFCRAMTRAPRSS